MSKSYPTEQQEQAMFFDWIAQYPILNKLTFHIPNGGKRNIIEATRLKAAGVKPGVPDIFIALPRGSYSGLFIEMKRQNVHRMSKAQIDWAERLQQAGYAVEMASGFLQAQQILRQYLSSSNKPSLPIQ